MFYERIGGKMVPLPKGTTVRELMASRHQLFAVHKRFKTDLKLYCDKKLEPKPSPLNYLVRIR